MNAFTDILIVVWAVASFHSFIKRIFKAMSRNHKIIICIAIIINVKLFLFR